MDFKTAFTHYQTGCASPEEHSFVENELEKYTLISEHFDIQWDEVTSPPSAPEQEISSLHKRLRKQNTTLVLTCLLLVAALLVVSVVSFAPTVKASIQEYQRQTVDEKLEEKARAEAEAEAAFWDPHEARFLEHVTDLQLTIDAYTELSCPGYDMSYLHITKTGFASYLINISRSNMQAKRENCTGTLTEGALQFDLDFQFSQPAVNIFSVYDEESISYYKERLQQLPEYVGVVAAIRFTNDLSIDELIALKETYDLDIEWSAVHVGEKTYGPCGMDIFSGGGIDYDLSASGYQDYNAMYYNSTPRQLENKFKTLLKFSADRMAEGKGIPFTTSDPNFYTNALEYVENHGVNFYGCFVIASPETLVKLMEQRVIRGICVKDAWIAI